MSGAVSIDRGLHPARWRGAAFALLLALAIAVRARDFGNPIIHVDEQYYLLVGDRMLHGALPYVDIWDRKPAGLFLIFAAIRLLPGDGILAYQLVATLFAAGTAWLVVVGGCRVGASPWGALIAGLAYILWLSFLSGRGGQSPVFYNLCVAGAAVLTLRLPALAKAERRGAIIANGAAACLLAGLAIQTKYTPAVEGAFFGLAHLWYLGRAGSSWTIIIGAAVIWASLGVAPTALVVAFYYTRGVAVFQAFWFANFTSVACAGAIRRRRSSLVSRGRLRSCRHSSPVRSSRGGNDRDRLNACWHSAGLAPRWSRSR